MRTDYVNFKLIGNDDNESLYIIKFDADTNPVLRGKIIDVMRRAGNRYITEGCETIESSLGRTLIIDNPMNIQPIIPK